MHDKSWRPYFISSHELSFAQECAGGAYMDSAPLSDQFSKDLHIVVLVACNEQSGYVRWSELPRMADNKVHPDDFQNVFDSAFLNAIEFRPPQTPSFILSESGLTKQVSLGGTNDSLLLVVGSFWRKLNAHCKGRLMASCPDNDILLLADSGAQGALAELTKRTEDCYQSSSKPLSKSLLVFNEYTWEDAADDKLP